MDDKQAIAVPRLALTPDEAAVSTGLARTRIYEAIKAERLTVRKDGKATVIEVDELARFLRSLPHRGRTPTEPLTA